MATVPAILGTARLGNFRLGYNPLRVQRVTHARITLGGVDAQMLTSPVRVRKAGLTIHDIINDAPNTCSFVADVAAPVTEEVLRVSINSDAPRLLFNGTLQTVDLSYGAGENTNLEWPCTAIDDQALANRRRPFGTWTTISATTIAQYLVQTYAPSFSIAGIALGLPTVSLTLDGSEGINGAFTQLAKLIGGYFKFEDLVAYLFVTDTTDQPDPIDVSHPFLNSPPITIKTDVSQLQTRVYGRGHGETLLSDVLVSDTILPVSNAAAWFGTVSITSKAISDSQVLTYTGVAAGGGGSLVGPGVSPSSALALTPAAGAGLGTGLYQYAYTDVTSAGETLPSPLASINVGAVIADPLVAPSGGLTNFGTGGPYPFSSGDHQRYWAYTFVTAGGETLPSPQCNSGAPDPLGAGGPFYMQLINLAIGSAGTTGRNIYRTVAGGSQLKLVASLDNVVVTYDDHTVDGSLGANVPTSSTASVGNQVAIAGVAQGATGTTSRNIYRTVVNGSQLKLQQTLADNTTTVGVQDATADGSLGANVPTGDTSGLNVVVSNPGAFYTGTGITFSTNGAATVANTSSPIFTSASYTFVSGDVGASVYIKSGTNWTPGTYVIASVSAGAATLVGACASVASPTNATWGVNYSTLDAARFTFTDLTIDAVTSTKLTSAAFPFGVNYIGNVIAVTGSVGFIAQRVIVASVSGTTGTCDKSVGTLSSTGGAGTLGGAAPRQSVLSGSTSLILAGSGSFRSAGGWAIPAVGQPIRYTGISGNTLTGIPASGTGAITITTPYNTQIAAAPLLTGVSGLVVALTNGAPIHLWVQADDLTAQATQAALDVTNGILPADGIYEGPVIVDERRGEASLIALCMATLRLYSTPIVTVLYATRDVKTKSGKTVTITLTNPPISQTLTIQEVSITEIDQVPGVNPRFTVTASTVRYSLENILKQLLAGVA